MEEEIVMDIRSEQDMERQGDPMDYPVAGQSLTEEPGARPRQNPPQMTDPNQVIEMLGKRFSQPEMKTKILETLGAGIPIESLVNTIASEGVYSGNITPDVAELIKPPLTVLFIQFAADEGIPVVVYAEDQDQKEADAKNRQQTLMNTLDEQSPEFSRGIRGARFQDEMVEKAEGAMGRIDARRELQRRSDEMPVESDGSFIDMEGV